MAIVVKVYSKRYQADQRFPFASTFKVLACGALLHKVDAGEEEQVVAPLGLESIDV